MNVYSKKQPGGMQVFNVALKASNAPRYATYPSIVEFATNPDRYKGEYPELFAQSNETIENDALM
jgi:hypothetical protein